VQPAPILKVFFSDKVYIQNAFHKSTIKKIINAVEFCDWVAF